MAENNLLEIYQNLEKVRNERGIPPLPLNVEQTESLCSLLQNPGVNDTDKLMYLFTERIAPGVSESAKVKAGFLNSILKGEIESPLVSKENAIDILSEMMGGFNIQPLIDSLKDDELADKAVVALSNTILIYDAFDTVLELSETNKYAKKVIESWANAEWFTSKPMLEEEIKLKVFRVDGEINTDDFSPASEAFSRPDIPLHALSMGASLFPNGVQTIAKWREDGHKVAFVGDVVGTGSSRKSACNSLLWHIGDDIKAVPNKRTKGVVLGGAIAPIFFNTVEDSGGLPITTDVTNLQMGDEIVVNTIKGEVTKNGEVVTTFKLSPTTLKDEYRAGGRIPLIIGRSLTDKARKALSLGESDVFEKTVNPEPKSDQGYTLAQKIIGRACGVEGVLPGTACEPKMTTVGSQDTTGPMTADEITELACMKFQSPLFMQSFCHTAAYPKPADIKTHRSLPKFISDRKGVSLKPGDGVIHTWLNRMLIPDTAGTGGDSHTRFPLGISFPAGSGLVAFAGALGFMPLDMPESVLVRFKGKLREGITLRDVVNAIPYFAIQKGLLTVPKKNKKNVFNGRVLEIEGLENITAEQAFELTDATAERSAAAGVIKLSEKSVVDYVRSNVTLLETLIKNDYSDAETIQNRVDELKEWLKNPKLLSADANAEYAEIIEIDLNDITEPILACPNDPDDVKLLSEVAGEKIQDVFIGSCMTNIGHFRAAAQIWNGQKATEGMRTYIVPPTVMDDNKLKEEALFSVFNQVSARIEVPGCSICMGNQLRTPDGVNVFSTSTRNFNNRMGKGAQVYLGSAEIAAIVTLMGEIPTPEKYFEIYKDKIKPNEDSIYTYLQFDEIEDFDL